MLNKAQSKVKSSIRYDLHHSQIVSSNIYIFILKFIQFEVKFEQFDSLILRTLLVEWRGSSPGESMTRRARRRYAAAQPEQAAAPARRVPRFQRGPAPVAEPQVRGRAAAARQRQAPAVWAPVLS